MTRDRKPTAKTPRATGSAETEAVSKPHTSSTPPKAAPTTARSAAKASPAAAKSVASTSGASTKTAATKKAAATKAAATKAAATKAAASKRATSTKTAASKKRASKPVRSTPVPSTALEAFETASVYRVDLEAQHKWPSVEVADLTYAGKRGSVEVAEAGKPFCIHYHRSPDDIGQAGELERIELFYRIDGGPVFAACIADGSRDPASGLLLRRAARIDVPTYAERSIEYWFKLTTTDGRVLWDSDFGKNYRAEIVPRGDVFVVFEGEASGVPIR